MQIPSTLRDHIRYRLPIGANFLSNLFSVTALLAETRGKSLQNVLFIQRMQYKAALVGDCPTSNERMSALPINLSNSRCRPPGIAVFSTHDLHVDVMRERLTSFTASVVNIKGSRSCTHTLSSMRIPIPLKCLGHRCSSGTYMPLHIR